MTVGYPEPGDLVKTVVDLVTAVNEGGGGSPDLSNYSNTQIGLTATDDNNTIVALSGDVILGAGTPSMGYPIELRLASVGGINFYTNPDNSDIRIEAGGANSSIHMISTGTAGVISLLSGELFMGATQGGVQISSPLGQGIQVIANDGNETIIFTPGFVEIACSGGDTTIDLSPTDVSISAFPLGGRVQLSGDNGNSAITVDGDGIQLGSLKHGFFGTSPVVRPHVPAIPTAQDVVDALVALGLIVQDA